MLTAPLHQSIDLGNGCCGTRSLVQDNEEMRRLAGSECVFRGQLRLTVEWGTVGVRPNRYTIQVTVGSMKKKGPYTLCWGRKVLSLWAVTNMFQGETWIFAAPNLAVVGIDFTTDMKCALITESYGVQKSLIVLYPIKYLQSIIIPGKPRRVLLHYDSSKRCICPLN
jgi:hypothetical protein